MYSRMALAKQCKIVSAKSHLQKVFWRKNQSAVYRKWYERVLEISPMEN